MVPLALLAGVPVALLATGVVLLDGWRTGGPSRHRLQQATFVGGVSFAGFLIPAVLDDAFHRAYLHGLKSNAVAVTPFELLSLHLAVGIGVTALTVVVYWTGARR